MKHFAICILLMLGATYSLYAQDRIILRNGTTIEVHVQRSLDNRVEYTYPGETAVYERPKTAISYILYRDGRKEVCDENLRSSEGSSSSRSSSRASSSRNVRSDAGGIFWEDVKTTFSEAEVRGMTRLNRISAASSISYKDAIQQLKKKAAAIGGTTILVMDVPESESEKVIEIIGIAYRDENMQYTPRTAGERSSASSESSSNIRRRRIAQQMESYNNESNIQTGNAPGNTRSSSSRAKSSSRQTSGSDESPDAVYLTSGRVIRGTIEELEPDDFVSIRTSAGKIYEYSMDDVKRISHGSASSARSKTSAKRSASRDGDDEYDNRRASSRRDEDYDNFSISGYKGIFDVGYDLPLGGTGGKGAFEINTSHGYQLNEYLFVGAGVGLHMYNARDAKMKDPNSYPQYVGNVSSTTPQLIIPTDSVTYIHAVDSSYMTLPVFLDVRGYYPIPNSAITPFAVFRIGYSFNLSDGFGGMGIYMNPAVGIKYQITPRIGINFSAGYAYQNYGGIPAEGGYGYYYYRNQAEKTAKKMYKANGAGGISLKLGVEF
jgi:hypothetical protein